MRIKRRKSQKKNRSEFVLSLRMRVTLLTGLIIFFSSFCLTFISVYNAHNKFFTVAQTMDAIAVKAYSINTELDAEVPPSITVETIGVEPNASMEYPMRIIVQDANQKFSRMSFFIMAMISMSGMTVSYFLAGKALKPIYVLNQTISHISKSNLSERLPEKKWKDEVNILTKSFNQMLARIEAAFLHEQRFAANAAHELKTPVAVIKTGIQVLELEEEPSTEDYKEVISITKRNVKRLEDVIDDLMTLTNKEYNYPIEEVSIIEVLKRIIEERLPYYFEKKLKISTRFEPEKIIFYGNERLSHHVFSNLIENAMKYNTDGGSLKIEVKEEKEEIQIKIADAGIGIPSNQIEHIFEPFYCVDPSRSRKLGGSGLGLSIVKMIADQFRWKIQVESEAGKGSVFLVRIPKDIKTD